MAADLPNTQRIRRATDLLFGLEEHFALNSESPVPLYYQLEQVIMDRINSQGVVGMMLPPELDLMRIFNVSRATVKKATDILAERGIISRKRAHGTEIISLGVREDLGRLTSYTEQMSRRGLSISTTVLEANLITPTPALRERLKLIPKEKVLSIHRLRGTSAVFPIVLLHSHIPAHYEIAPNEDFSTSLYNLLETKYRLPILYADEQISARPAQPEEAKLLNIKPQDTVLVMERMTYTTHDHPLEHVSAVYRPEHYTFSIRLRR